MNAPDKIYVREYPQGLNQMWSSVLATETSAIEQHVYIRKDALLELLREKRKAITECSATKERKVAALSVIDFLIDKISKL